MVKVILPQGMATAGSMEPFSEVLHSPSYSKVSPLTGPSMRASIKGDSGSGAGKRTLTMEPSLASLGLFFSIVL